MSNLPTRDASLNQIRIQLPLASERIVRLGESLTPHRRGSGQPHKGRDLFAAAGTPVYAVEPGRVIRIVDGTEGSASQQRAGRFVDLLDDAGYVWRYLHLGERILVRRNERVKAGQQIGTVGTSGVHHAQPHLHLEKRAGDYDAARRDYGEPLDPLPALNHEPNRSVSMDIDWKGILDKALTVGGPILGTVANTYAPGSGGLVVAGTQALNDRVVKPYVPGTEPTAPAAEEAAPPPVIVAPRALPESETSGTPPSPSSEGERAAQKLAQRGWSQADIERALAGPPQAQTPTDDSAHIVHGVLEAAGWHLEDRLAILQGPYAFHRSRQVQHVPDARLQAEFAQHDPTEIHKRHLYRSTEPAGHAPEAYHGTDDAHRAGLGHTTERVGTLTVRPASRRGI